MPTVPTFAVRETLVSRTENVGTVGMNGLSQAVDVKTLKVARKPVKLQKENPAGCAGEGKQSEGN